nr:tripartite tricarboxylate transporter substrate-binding protein [Bradyrhizobium valentinum]
MAACEGRHAHGTCCEQHKRSAALPEVPTTAEAGFIDAEYPFWIGMFLPARTPRTIVDKLQSEVAKALATPSVRSKVAALGVDSLTMSPSKLDTFVRKQMAADAALAK